MILNEKGNIPAGQQCPWHCQCEMANECARNEYIQSEYSCAAARGFLLVGATPDSDLTDNFGLIDNIAMKNVVKHACPMSYQQETHNKLSEAYSAWCSAQGLQCIDAEELLEQGHLDTNQREWLGAFINLWDLTICNQP